MDMQISKSQLRKALKSELRTTSQFDAFVMDRFPAIYQQFSPAMELEQKINILFALVGESDVCIIWNELKMYVEQNRVVAIVRLKGHFGLFILLSILTLFFAGSLEAKFNVNIKLFKKTLSANIVIKNGSILIYLIDLRDNIELLLAKYKSGILRKF